MSSFSLYAAPIGLVAVLLSTSAHADEREAHIFVDVGAGGGVAGSGRTPVASIGPAPSVVGGAGLRYGLTNQLAVSVGMDVEVVLGATSPGAIVTVQTSSAGSRQFNGALQSDTFLASLPIRAEYSLDLPVALIDFAIADIYFAASVSPSAGYVVNNRLLDTSDSSLALVGPGELPPDIVFGCQTGFGVGGRIRAFDFASADVELRLRAGFIGDFKATALIVVRPTVTFFPFAIF